MRAIYSRPDLFDQMNNLQMEITHSSISKQSLMDAALAKFHESLDPKAWVEGIIWTSDANTFD